jgi:galactose mutarotase-like enzyme
VNYELSNEYLTLRVNSHGAEVVSLRNNKTGREVIWTADPKYWDEHSPLLFPCVGGNWDGKIHVVGQTYNLPKHGLVKNMEFELTDQTENELIFGLSDTPETLEAYPFQFQLLVRYQLVNKCLNVDWFIQNNTPGKSMPFMIGGHPAFLLPDFDPEDEVHGYLHPLAQNELVSKRTLPYGFVMPGQEDRFPLDHHRLPLGNKTFECDTILDVRQCIQAVSVEDKEGRELQTVTWMGQPVVAFWSPCNGCCPFVCIEPWFGCCDEYQASLPFAERPFVNILPPDQTTELGYMIAVQDF